MENLDDYLEKATHLPATPTILINLMALLRKVDTDIDEIVELISMDPSITAGVIQLCNSAISPILKAPLAGWDLMKHTGSLLL